VPWHWGYLDGVFAGAEDGGGGSDPIVGMVVAALPVRPAFAIDAAAVVFASDAGGGKSAAARGGGFVAMSAPAGPVKLTMASPLQTVDVVATTAQAGQSVPASSALAFTYAGATVGANQFVSAALEQAGQVKYYAKLADTSAQAAGPLEVPLAGVADGAYTLKVFSEEANGDNFTDFCSDPETMTVTVGGGTATVTGFGGTVVRSADAGLAAVAGQPVAAGSQAGTAAEPKTAAVSVANGQASVAVSDVAAAEPNAEAHLYSDAAFSADHNAPINLVEGGATHVYVKVVAEDGSTLHYDVTVNRAAATYALSVSAGPGGAVDGTVSGDYDAGHPVTVTAAPNAIGQRFAGWTVTGAAIDGGASANPATFTMPPNPVTLTANFEADGSGIAADTLVGFAGHTWDVIGKGGAGVWSSPDTMTLLLDAADTGFGETAFRTRANEPQGPGWTEYGGFYWEGSFSYPADYADSTLQRKLAAIAAGFPAQEQALINPRILSGAADWHNPMKGPDVEDQVRWPLATVEAHESKRPFPFYWWLRSSYGFDSIDTGETDGDWHATAIYVWGDTVRIRPALGVDVSSVVLVSDAVGGKGADVGDGFTGWAAPAGAVKLTAAVPEQSLEVVATT
jgi:uncharacterized repeat protein (TIGR02543 family)